MTWQAQAGQLLKWLQRQFKLVPAWSRAFWQYSITGALYRDALLQSRHAFDYLQQLPRWRLAALGAALYLLVPLWFTPIWQLQLLTQDSTASAARLQTLLAFYQQYGGSALPALEAQLALDKLHRLEQQLIADNATFSSQSRDEKWAEATEFMIAHLAQSVTDNQLRILDAECRNNLCQIDIYAPNGLTPEFQALVLKYAATLKRGDLEFKDLLPGKGRLRLELKSDKKLKYGYWASRKLEPSEKQHWLQQVNSWLYPTPAANAPQTGEVPPTS